MLDAFTMVVSQADSRGQLVNDSQIDALLAMVKEGAKRTKANHGVTGDPGLELNSYIDYIINAL